MEDSRTNGPSRIPTTSKGTTAGRSMATTKRRIRLRIANHSAKVLKPQTSNSCRHRHNNFSSTPLQTRQIPNSLNDIRARPQPAYFGDENQEDESSPQLMDENSHDVPEQEDQWYYPDDGHLEEPGDQVDAHFVTQKEFTCRRCKATFYSNNKLHRHIRSYQQKAEETIFVMVCALSVTNGGKYELRRMLSFCSVV